MPNERVSIFIDGSNLYRCMKDQFGRAGIDLRELCARLCGDRSLVRSYYYNAALPQNVSGYQDQQRFLAALRYIPYFQLRLGRLERRAGQTWVEKGVDILLAVDMLQEAQRNIYDTAILVSGDGDFASVVDAVKALGKHVENAFVRVGQSRALRESSDRFIALDKEFLQGLWLEKE